MRLPAALLAVAGLAPAAGGAEPDARPAVDAGLKFLAGDAVAWKEERQCASCHHAPMALWALNEARARGYAVDDKAGAGLTAWVLATDDPARVNPKQKERPEANANQAPLMLALGIAAGGPTDPATRAGLKAMLDLVVAGQDKDGACRLLFAWEPIGSPPDVITTLSLLALTSPYAPDLGPAG